MTDVETSAIIDNPSPQSLEAELEATKRKLARTERLLEKTVNYNEDLRKQVETLSAELHGYRSSAQNRKEIGVQVNQRQLAAETEVDADLPDWGVVTEESNQVEDVEPVSIAESLKATAEAALQQTGYVFDENSGLYYDYKSGYYYDAERSLYYDSNTGTYFYYNDDTKQYDFHSQIDISQYSNVRHHGNQEDDQNFPTASTDGERKSSKKKTRKKTKEREENNEEHRKRKKRKSRREGKDVKQRESKEKGYDKTDSDDENEELKIESRKRRKKHQKKSRKEFGKTDSSKKKKRGRSLTRISEIVGTDLGRIAGLNRKQRRKFLKEIVNSSKKKKEKIIASTSNQNKICDNKGTAEISDKVEDECSPNRTSEPMETDICGETGAPEKAEVEAIFSDDDGDDKCSPETSAYHSNTAINLDLEKICEEKNNSKTDHEHDESASQDATIYSNKENFTSGDQHSQDMSVDDTKLTKDNVPTSDDDDDESEMESGELSESSSESDSTSESSSSLEGLDQEGEEIAANWPPCIRMIATDSDCLDVGTLYIVTFTGATIGREKNTVEIPDLNISKFHCEIHFNETDGQYMITDQGSQNGTFLNNNRISQAKVRSSPTSLAHGDILQIGGTIFLLHIHSGTDTCDDCEPGQVKAQVKAKEEANREVVILTKEQKIRLQKQELKQIKQKYGLKNASYVDNIQALNNPDYKDKAAVRRKTIGSDVPGAKVEVPASVYRPISEKNVGHKLLKKLGWTEGESLGKGNEGIQEPITVSIRSNQAAGLGSFKAAAHSLDNVQSVRKSQIWLQAQQRFNKLEAKTGNPKYETEATKAKQAWVQGQTEQVQGGSITVDDEMNRELT